MGLLKYCLGCLELDDGVEADRVAGAWSKDKDEYREVELRQVPHNQTEQEIHSHAQNLMRVHGLWLRYEVDPINPASPDQFGHIVSQSVY